MFFGPGSESVTTWDGRRSRHFSLLSNNRQSVSLIVDHCHLMLASATCGSKAFAWVSMNAFTGAWSTFKPSIPPLIDDTLPSVNLITFSHHLWLCTITIIWILHWRVASLYVFVVFFCRLTGSAWKNNFRQLFTVRTLTYLSTVCAHPNSFEMWGEVRVCILPVHWFFFQISLGEGMTGGLWGANVCACASALCDSHLQSLCFSHTVQDHSNITLHTCTYHFCFHND